MSARPRLAGLLALALCTACAGTSSVRLRNDIGDITSDYNHGSELNHWQPIASADWKADLANARLVELLGDSLGLLPSASARCIGAWAS